MRNIKNENSQKGSAIVMMIVAIAVMMLLSVNILSSSSYTYRYTKMLGDGDSTFFAAESASRRMFAFTKSILSANPYYGINQKLVSGSEALYVDNVLKDIVKESAWNKYIEVNGDQGRTFKVDFGRFEIHEWSRAKSSITGLDVIKAKVGILTVSSCYMTENPSIITTNNKRLFFEDTLEVPYYEPIKLTSSILSIGDIVAKGSGFGLPGLTTANIYGDVLSYGTFPKGTISPRQYFYGGIMAIQNAQLNIFGNAYSRGFVRSGAYMNSSGQKIIDASEVNVSKDIVAQCIQTFSEFSKIYSYRNAYTFDDMEINGENSIIGINGSYFGLSDNKTSRNHDENSCILNSSALHYTLGSTSNSRVVINGDVVIAGSGYKIDQNGHGVFEIESAGLIYPEDNTLAGFSQNVPTYKYVDEIDPSGLLTDLTVPYVEFLKNSAIRKFGYVNVIQGYAPVVTGYYTSATISPNIGIWKQQIGNLITGSDYNNRWAPFSTFVRPATINGITGSTLVGANDSIYWDANYTLDPGLLVPGKYMMVERLSVLANSYQLDGFTPSDIGEVYKYGNGTGTELTVHNFLDEEKDATFLTTNIMPKVERFWNYYWKEKNITAWDTYLAYTNDPANIVEYPDIQALPAGQSAYINVMKQEEGGYIDSDFKSHIPNLLDLLNAKVNKIARRTYPPEPVDLMNPTPAELEWRFDVDNTISETIEKIKSLKLKLGATVPASYIVVIPDTDFSTTTTSAINVATYAPDGNLTPYLIVCEDSNTDIEVNTTFKGIIMTKSRVIVKTNGLVLGAVIATGRNRENFNKSTVDVDGVAPANTYNVNRVDPNDMAHMTLLNNGDLAGLILETTGLGTPPTIDFYMGNSSDVKYHNIYSTLVAREDLLKAFNDVGVPLFQIF